MIYKVSNRKNKQKVAVLVVFIALAAYFVANVFLQNVFLQNKTESPQTNSIASPTPTTQQNDEPKIVSTKPSPLHNSVIVPTETIEITFNYPLENVGEFKVRLAPKTENYKIELSSDRKTGKIIPVKPFQLGAEYHIFVDAGETGTKFDGGKRLKEQIEFIFKTIEYKGV